MLSLPSQGMAGMPLMEKERSVPGPVIVLRLEGQVKAPRPDTGQLLAERLATRALAWLQALQPAGLVLVGGDTSVATLAALGAHGLRIQSEVQSGIPQGWLVGGPYHGLPVVTKAGAFGNPQALVAAVESLGYATTKTPRHEKHEESELISWSLVPSCLCV